MLLVLDNSTARSHKRLMILLLLLLLLLGRHMFELSLQLGDLPLVLLIEILIPVPLCMPVFGLLKALLELPLQLVNHLVKFFDFIIFFL